MNEEDEAFNEIERMSKVRQEILRSLNRKRQIQDAEYKALIEAAVEAEREACADIAENWNSNGFPRTGVAAQIRARGQA